MKIYTKVGDGGNTFLSGGKKARKNDPVVEALGAVDELNASVGWARSLGAGGPLEEAQRLLFVLGAQLAGAPAPHIAPSHALWAEKEMDALEASLPPLKTFILPGGSPAGAALHLARTVCRRAERALVPLLKKKRASEDAQIFLNRLSDLFFLLARDENRKAGGNETPWVP